MTRFSKMTAAAALLMGSALPSFAQNTLNGNDVRALASSIGANVAWTGEARQIGNSIVVSRALLARGEFNVTADQLIYDGAGVTFQGASILPAQGQRGRIDADEISISGEEGLAFFFHELDHVSEILGSPKFSQKIGDDAPVQIEDHHGEEFCESLKSASRKADVRATNVTLEGDMDAMLPNLPNSEQIKIDELVMSDVLVEKGQSCDNNHNMVLSNVAVVAVDGARLQIGTVDLEERMKDTRDGIGSSFRAFLTLNDLQLMDSGGYASAMIEEVSASMTEDDAWLFALSEIRYGDGLDETVMASFAQSTAGMGLEVKGLDLDTHRFFPKDVIHSFGLSDIDRITGDFSVDASLEGGAGRLDADASFPQIVRGEIGLSVRLPEIGGASLPAMITDRIPVPADLLGLELMGFNILYEDLNIGQIFETATGFTPEERVEDVSTLVKARLAGLPSSLTSLVDESFGALAQIAKNGGKIVAKPQDPQSLMALGMQALVNPTSLKEMLGIDIEIWE